MAETGFIIKVLFENADNRGIGEIFSTGRNWPAILDECHREGVVPLFYHRIVKRGWEADLPAEVLEQFRTLFRQTIRKNSEAVKCLGTIGRSFDAEGIPWIVLKGIALAETVYPHFALRPASDIDILVPRPDFMKADAALTSMGYSSVDSPPGEALRNPPGYLASVEYRAGSEFPPIHLHWHPVNTSTPAAFASEIDIESLWRESRPVLIGGVPSRMFSPEHLLIYLCEHALRIGHSFDRLNLICDIHYAVQAFQREISWGRFADECRRSGLSRFAYLALEIVRSHTGLHALDKPIAMLKPSRLRAGERLFLKLQLAGKRIRGSSFLLYLDRNRGMRNKLLFLLRTLVPPRSVLKQKHYQGRLPFRCSLYLRRIIEVAGHLPFVFRGALRRPGREVKHR